MFGVITVAPMLLLLCTGIPNKHVTFRQNKNNDCSVLFFYFISGTYFAVVMTLVALSCLATVIVLIVHHKASQGKRVPSWLRTLFFTYVATILRVDVDDKYKKSIFGCKVSINWIMMCP